jgi:hypothetical protein
LSAAERNYPIHEQELLAFIHALKHWRHYLLGRHFDAYTDHHSLQYLQTQPQLSGRRARWSDLLQEFDVTIHYKKGATNIVADALSRRADLKFSSLHFTANLSLPEISHEKQCQVSSWKHIIDALSHPESLNSSDQIMCSNFALRGHRLYRKGRLCVPPGDTRKQLLSQCHDSVFAAHPGVNRTYAKLARSFYWPRMYSDVEKFISSCDVCQRVKSRNDCAAGLLQPLPVPSRNWDDISMDFIVELPKCSAGFNAILTVVCRLSKQAHFIPLHTTATAQEVAKLFVAHIFRLHGLPSRIVSDRDPKFVSHFWTESMKLLGVTKSLSSGYHPQTDGQTEIVNRQIEQMLRCYLNHKMNNWSDLLPLLEFAYNDSVSQSTSFTPFYLNYGFHPTSLSFVGPLPESAVPTSSEFVDHLRSVVSAAKDSLELAQERAIRQANRHRKDVSFEDGDLVLVSSIHVLPDTLKSRPSAKFQPKFFGPFRVRKKIGPVAYRLDLPSSCAFHPTVHVSRLRKYEQTDPSIRPALILPDSF